MYYIKCIGRLEIEELTKSENTAPIDILRTRSSLSSVSEVVIFIDRLIDTREI